MWKSECVHVKVCVCGGVFVRRVYVECVCRGVFVRCVLLEYMCKGVCIRGVWSVCRVVCMCLCRSVCV